MSLLQAKLVSHLVVVSLVLAACTPKIEAPVIAKNTDLPSQSQLPEVSTRPKPPTSEYDLSDAREYEANPSTEPEVDWAQSRIPESGYHIVIEGNTLYSIAWQYGLDYSELSLWNKIPDPYIIYPKQVLRLKPPKVKPPKVNSKGSTVSKPAAAPKRPEQQLTAVKKKTIKKKQDNSRTKEPAVKWNWPVKGVVKSSAPTSRKGIDIYGNIGQEIRATSAGKVVYSGNGLRSYGKLIIIKHDASYLSAYAYNKELLVREGDSVMAGDVISMMGEYGGQSLLYFEIRKNGSPVDPLLLLPEQKASKL